ncbi:hypothetical protein PMAYCL1PPCAC_05080, partial [Pristionchus mayeri]
MRTIRPNDFNIGPAPFGEKSIYIGAYNRVHYYLNANGKCKRSRSRVQYPFAPLYACRAHLRERDCMRRDDYESWLYMVFDLYDQRWIKTESSLVLIEKAFSNTVFKGKITLFPVPDNFFEKIPESLRDVVEMIRGCHYKDIPDPDRTDMAVRALLPVDRGSSWWRLDWEGHQPIDMQTSVYRPPTLAAGSNI